MFKRKLPQLPSKTGDEENKERSATLRLKQVSHSTSSTSTIQATLKTTPLKLVFSCFSSSPFPFIYSHKGPVGHPISAYLSTTARMGGRGNQRDVVLDIIKPSSFTGGLEFSTLTYTVTKKEKDEDGKWSSKEVDLLHRVTGIE